MKTMLLLLLLAASSSLFCQLEQNINTLTDTLSYGVSEIDSIQLDANGATMTLFLIDSTSVIVPLGDINNVTFSESLTDLHTCGADEVHNSNLEYGSVIDQDGNSYKTIIIGTQEWMAENLKTSHYQNGDAIPNITDSLAWLGLNSGAWCYYNNDSTFNCPYGKLYNWYVVSDTRNVCPNGWHVPTDDEWSVLINQIDANADGGNLFNLAGGKMKSTGNTYWVFPNADASNVTGFSALPGGLRYYGDGTFFSHTYNSYWWSASNFVAEFIWARYLGTSTGVITRDYYYKRYGFSIRCLKD